MKLFNLLASAFLMAPLSNASPVPDTAENNNLVKRNAWTVYLYNGQNCDTSTSQGGYSNFGSQPCTTIFSDSVEADTQGCDVILFADTGCSRPAYAFPQGDTCFSVQAPVPGALQSFLVSC